METFWMVMGLILVACVAMILAINWLNKYNKNKERLETQRIQRIREAMRRVREAEERYPIKRVENTINSYSDGRGNVRTKITTTSNSSVKSSLTVNGRSVYNYNNTPPPIVDTVYYDEPLADVVLDAMPVVEQAFGDVLNAWEAEQQQPQYNAEPSYQPDNTVEDRPSINDYACPVYSEPVEEARYEAPTYESPTYESNDSNDSYDSGDSGSSGGDD